jgi:hypothetical protein
MANNLGNGNDRSDHLIGPPIGQYLVVGAIGLILVAVLAWGAWWLYSKEGRHSPAPAPQAPRHEAAARPPRAHLLPAKCPGREEAALRPALLAQAHREVRLSSLTAAEKRVADAAIDARPEGNATRWHGRVVTRVWELALPGRVGMTRVPVSRECVCRVWGRASIAPPPAPPPKRSWLRKFFAAPPPVIRQRAANCFAYHVVGNGELPQYAALQPDGEPYPRVRNPLQVEMLFYPESGYTRRMLEADPCFYAVDNLTHERLRLSHDCSFCAPGDRQRIWPADIEEGAETDFLFSIYSADGTAAGCPSGDCTVYVPRRAMSSLWCFATKRYHDRRRWHYDGYSFRITRAELARDLGEGRSVYRELVRPLGVFGWNQ